MDTSHAQHLRSDLFTVRVWLEVLGDGKTEWRGQVKHVLSGEVRYFRELMTLANHMLAMLSFREGSISQSSREPEVAARGGSQRTEEH